MKYVRKLLLISFCAMLLTFTACGNNDANDGNNTVNDATDGSEGPVTDGNPATDNHAVDGVGAKDIIDGAEDNAENTTQGMENGTNNNESNVAR